MCYVRGVEIADLDDQWLDYLRDASVEDVANDLINFCSRPGVSTLTPLTISVYVSTARGYLLDACGIQLTPIQKRMMMRKFPKPRPVTEDAEPERSMWRDILMHCDVRTSAELLIALSGGLRIGEVLGLRIPDVDMDQVPTVVKIPSEISKNGLSRITYISAEATDALKLYYKSRDAIIITAEKRLFRSERDRDLIFPFKPKSEQAKLNVASFRAGHGARDPRTRRRKVHFHLARKFFLTEAKTAAHPEFVEAWAGHAGYLASAYHRPTARRDREEYLKAEPALLINVPEDYYRVKVEQANEIIKLQTASADQQRVINRLLDELTRVRDRQDMMVTTQIRIRGDTVAPDDDDFVN